MRTIKTRYVVASCLAGWAGFNLLLIAGSLLVNDTSMISRVTVAQRVLFLLASALSAMSIILLLIKFVLSVMRSLNSTGTPALSLYGIARTLIDSKEKETRDDS
jgi:hypothetical protein